MKPKEFNKHHIIQQCERNQYNVDDDRNIVMMEVVRHNALHALFKNITTPKEQLDELSSIYNKILSPRSKRLILELLSLTDEEFYAKGLVKKRREH